MIAFLDFFTYFNISKGKYQSIFTRKTPNPEISKNKDFVLNQVKKDTLLAFIIISDSIYSLIKSEGRFGYFGIILSPLFLVFGLVLFMLLFPNQIRNESHKNIFLFFLFIRK